MGTFFVILLMLLHLAQSTFASGGEIEIPSGSYIPFFVPPASVRIGNIQKSEARPTPSPSLSNPREPVLIQKFKIDLYPVTNGEFLLFVGKNREWRRSLIPRIFADKRYLTHWKSDLTLSRESDRELPVTNVSWHAAIAYCEWKGKELPTTDQWEYVGHDAGRDTNALNTEILKWYGISATVPLRPVKQSRKNGYGVYGLFGLIWEWTLDFNNLMTSGESRSSGTQDENLFCGTGGLGSLDATDYAKFMRFSFRSSLKANYTTSQLGFRCSHGEL